VFVLAQPRPKRLPILAAPLRPALTALLPIASVQIRPLFSITSPLLFSQLLSFDIHTNCPGGWGGMPPTSNLEFLTSATDGRTAQFLDRLWFVLSALGEEPLNPLESALPQNARVTPLESALTNLKDLKSFRIRTYKKRGEGGETVDQRIRRTLSVPPAPSFEGSDHREPIEDSDPVGRDLSSPPAPRWHSYQAPSFWLHHQIRPTVAVLWCLLSRPWVSVRKEGRLEKSRRHS
jgi:hypothetical protein